MKREIGDLYSQLLITEKVMPCFENYYDVEFSQGYDMKSHQHHRIELMYVSNSKCTVAIENDILPLNNGEFVLINGGISHKLSIEKGKNCRIANLEFLFRINDNIPCTMAYLYNSSLEFRRFINSKKSYFKLPDLGNLHPTIRNLIYELESNEPGSEFILSMGILELFLKIARIYCESEATDNDSANIYVNKGINFMRRNYFRNISINDIACYLNLSTRYFQKIFKQITGQTPSDYLNKVRMEKAKLLLQKTEIPLADLCLMVGVNNRQYFSYLFKKYSGTSPKEFREFTTNTKPSRMFSCDNK